MENDFTRTAGEAVNDSESVILDVRREDEWNLAHADRAIHWELARLEKGEFPDVLKDARIYTYCAAGGRAGKAAEILRANGWTSVKNLGGLSDWQRAGGGVINR